MFLLLPCSASAGNHESRTAGLERSQAEAKLHFDRGVALFKDEDYKLALAEFRRAYESGGDFRVLYNIGQVHYQLGNYAEAKRTLVKFLADGADHIAATTRAGVTSDIEALSIRTGTLTLRANVGGADVLVDGEKNGVTAAPGSTLVLLVNSGPHRITLQKNGFTDTTKNLSLVGGEDRALTFELAEKPAEPRAFDPLWIGFGGTGLLAVGAGISGVAWGAARSEYDDVLKRQTTRDEVDDKGSKVDRYMVLTLALGGAALVAGVISTVVSLSRSTPRRVGLWVTPAGAGGRF
jgi:tetratricopeptide (TPR) repeat protein